MPKASSAVQANAVVPPKAVNPAQHIETVKALFDAHPEDVISPIKSATEALDWIEEILLTIKRDADDAGRNALRIKRLAGAAAYIAADIANYAGCQHEAFIGRLQNAGVLDSSAGDGGEA
jgi:hypothetical protein